MYEIGKIYEFDGQKRKVVGFTDINGQICPNTEPSDGEPEETEEKPAEKLVCRYCGKEFKTKVGLTNHEKYCKEKK